MLGVAYSLACYPHRWRHTNLSQMFAEGMPHEAIRERAGHLSDAVLADYLTITDTTRQQWAARAALADKWNL